MALIFRPMQVADLDNVLCIERAAYSHPWTKGMFADSLESGYECWVVLQGKELIGHAVLSIVCDEAHLLTLCVSPHQQRKGVGRAMLERLLLRAKAEKAEMIFLEVRESNQAAQQLYLSMGFNQIGERKNYYPDRQGREDAIIFALQILNE